MFINKSSLHSILGLDNLDLDILKLTAEGFTNVEIADKLNLSENKALTLKKKMLVKTKSKNTASLVSFGFRYGILK